MSKYLTSLLSLLCALAAAGTAAAQSNEPRVISAELEFPVGSEEVPSPVGERASRVATIDVDLSPLYSAGEREKDVTIPIPGVVVEIELFKGEIYSLTGLSVIQTGDVWSWVGRVNDTIGREAVLTIDRGSVFGTVNAPGHDFTILTDKRGRHWVRENDPKQALGDVAIPAIPASEIGEKTPLSRPPSAPMGGSSDTLDVLILYTAAAATDYPTFSVVATGVASADTGFSNSGVTGNVRIVGYQYSSYTEPGTGMTPDEQEDVLDAMRDSTGAFTGLSTLKDSLNADIVMLVYDSSTATTACGSAFTLINPTGSWDWAAAVAGDGCMGSWHQFTHEIGHVLGSQHDYPTACAGQQLANLCCYMTSGTSNASHGYTHTTSPVFRDIMGSAASCSWSSCDRLNRFSDPAVTYLSYPVGVSGESEMASVLETNLCVTGGSLSLVADYDAPSGSSPGQPGTFTVTNMVCYGFNELDWGASSGDVGWYELESSTSSMYTSPSVIYRGSDPGLIIDVAGTRYLRVKACNSIGCSSWRNGNTAATVYPGCA